jgi:hypothetical protein
MKIFFSSFNTTLAFIVGLYVLVSYLICLYFGVASFFRPVMYLKTGLFFSGVLLVGYIAFLVLRIYYIMIFIRPKELKNYIWNMLRRGPLRLSRYKQAVIPFVLFIFFFSTFTSMKTLIPNIHPFYWDTIFANMDKALHFGKHPWEILQPFLGYPIITASLNQVYNLWLPMVFIVLYWQLFSEDHKYIRTQYFYSFVLTWMVGGTILAIILSSAGPCFFENVTYKSTYAPLMNYLNTAYITHHIPALEVQNSLWQKYQDQKIALGAGISAMPSIHVATAFLFMLLGWSRNNILGCFFTIFYVLIFLGSIHLSWHYAIDGYGGTIVALFMWGFAEKLIKAQNKLWDDAHGIIRGEGETDMLYKKPTKKKKKKAQKELSD